MGEQKIIREQECPSCGSEDGWYPAGRINLGDMIVAQLGGPKAPVEMSIKGGDCLSCGYEEEAAYQDA